MTTSPIPLRDGPYLKIVDYSHQYNVEESVVLIRHIGRSTSSEAIVLTASDIYFGLLLILSFIVCVAILGITNDDILIAYPTICRRVSNIAMKIILPVFHMGKSSLISMERREEIGIFSDPLKKPLRRRELRKKTRGSRTF